MEALGRTDVVASECFMVDGDDLLNFSLDGEEDEDEDKTTSILKGSSSYSSSNPLISHHDDLSGSSSFPEFVEEELEWLSNKDAFPSVETCFDILSENPDIMGSDHQSPISVLENSTSSSSNGNSSANGSSIMSCCRSLQVPTGFPVRARSKRRRTRRRVGLGDLPSQQWLWWNQVNVKNKQQEIALPPLPTTTNGSASIGRRCLHCGADKTPQWRAGPMGPKTLCNACGVRYKSGRLVPEYRPASSPTYSASLHSNSHRKIIEMRRQKQVGVGGIMANEACGYRVG